MNDQECNKIIAEYIGSQMDYSKTYIEFLSNDHYTKSLDSLAPIWDNLDCDVEILNTIHGYMVFIATNLIETKEVNVSLTKAAAYATAEVIQELK